MNKTILFIASGVCILGLVGCVPHYHDYNYDGYERHAPPPPKHKPAPAEKYHIIKSHKVAPKAHIPPKPAPKAHTPPKPAPKLKPHDKKYDNKPASRPPRDERGHRR